MPTNGLPHPSTRGRTSTTKARPGDLSLASEAVPNERAQDDTPPPTTQGKNKTTSRNSQPSRNFARQFNPEPRGRARAKYSRGLR